MQCSDSCNRHRIKLAACMRARRGHSAALPIISPSNARGESNKFKEVPLPNYSHISKSNGCLSESNMPLPQDIKMQTEKSLQEQDLLSLHLYHLIHFKIIYNQSFPPSPLPSSILSPKQFQNTPYVPMALLRQQSPCLSNQIRNFNSLFLAFSFFELPNLTSAHQHQMASTKIFFFKDFIFFK